MHVALMADGPWLEAEPATFKALEVGLLGEQIKVTHVVPEGSEWESVTGFSARLTWRDSSLPWIRERRVAKLGSALTEHGVQVLHAMDARVWPAAARLAKQANLPVILACSSIHDAPRATKAVKGLDPARVGLIGTTQPITDALRRAVGADLLIEKIAPGVHVPEQFLPRRQRPEAPCLVVSGTGRFDAQYEAAFTALRRYVEQRPQAQFFLEARGSDQHGLWQAARRLDLLTHVSLVPPQVSRHQVLLQADALIQPQASGRSRTFTLNAMVQGIPVLALADPAIDYLVDQQTAWVVEAAEQHRWTVRLDQLDSDWQGVESLIDSARQWCSKRHLLSHRVVQVVKLYHSISGGSSEP